MRKMILLVAVVALVVAMPALALAGGWDAPTADPHGGYAQTTNYCKSCHAVHEAEDAANSLNGQKLLRSTVVGACDYCHVSANFPAIAKVYNSDPAQYADTSGNEHSLGANKVALDSGDAAGTADPASDYTFATFGCVSCHTVHGAGALGFGSFILKANPYTGDVDTATNETEFCADCHDNNLVTAKDTAGADQVSHYMGVAVAGQSVETAEDCRNCHDGGTSVAANSYPHMTTGQQFLKDAYDGNGNGGTELDGVCIDCHTTVGVAY